MQHPTDRRFKLAIDMDPMLLHGTVGSEHRKAVWDEGPGWSIDRTLRSLDPTGCPAWEEVALRVGGAARMRGSLGYRYDS